LDGELDNYQIYVINDRQKCGRYIYNTKRMNAWSMSACAGKRMDGKLLTVNGELVFSNRAQG
jgi:hypothetical protein